jgi:hypothetical protein
MRPTYAAPALRRSFRRHRRQAGPSIDRRHRVHVGGEQSSHAVAVGLLAEKTFDDLHRGAA